MDEKIVHYRDGVELRRRAEDQLREKAETSLPPCTEAEPLKLLHELQVYRVELEMQNAELRQSRNEAETTLERYTDLYDFAPVGYVTLDRNGTIRAVNLTGSSLMGVERSRLIGHRFEQFVSIAGRSIFSAFLGKVFMGPVKEACEVTLLKEEKTEIFVQIEGIVAESGVECRIALIDITERKRSEEALRLAKETAEVLRLAKEAAEATTKAKSQFLANMSHELRTPMTGILGMLQLALEENLAPVPREYLETSLSSARSLLRILNDILYMAKIEAEKLTIEEKPFSLKVCLTETVDIVSPEIRRKGLEFAISVAKGVPDTLVGDNVRLRQVLINLVGNAVKFTERGKVVVRVSSGTTSPDGKRKFTFAVTDTGIGIPAGNKEVLFHAFSQLDATHSRRYGGTGLGLAICSGIVELMGGTISFESEEGVGSTFSFTIPLGESESENYDLTAAEYLLPETITVPEGGRIPHLLLAEDDPVSRKVLELMLKRSSYTLDVVEDGLKAIEMWEKGEYDLVLMDVQMPRLNGLEATRAIRENERERGVRTPIIAMTAHARKEDEEDCLASGMDAYITKPIDFKKCLQVIGQFIKQKSGGVSS